MLDDSVLTAIVDAAGVAPGDLVLEIGPGGCWAGCVRVCADELLGIGAGYFVAAAVIGHSMHPASPAGTGNLTRHLLAAGALVTAVEKDEALSAQLATEFAEVRPGVSYPAWCVLPCPCRCSEAHLAPAPCMHDRLPPVPACPALQVPQLRLVVGDILLQDLPRLLAGMRQQAEQQQGQQQQQQQQHQGQQDVQQPAAAAAQEQQSQQPQQQSKVQVKVVANLPYYITKDCLLQMLPLGADISHLYFMLQARCAGWVYGCWGRREDAACQATLAPAAALSPPPIVLLCFACRTRWGCG